MRGRVPACSPFSRTVCQRALSRGLKLDSTKSSRERSTTLTDGTPRSVSTAGLALQDSPVVVRDHQRRGMAQDDGAEQQLELLRAVLLEPTSCGRLCVGWQIAPSLPEAFRDCGQPECTTDVSPPCDFVTTFGQYGECRAGRLLRGGPCTPANNSSGRLPALERTGRQPRRDIKRPDGRDSLVPMPVQMSACFSYKQVRGQSPDFGSRRTG